MQSALRIIDCLSTSLPPSQVFSPLQTLVAQYTTSANPSHRRAAMMALGVCVEGCSEFIKPHMNDIWTIIQRGFIDADASVRKATCTAVSCFCEWLEDECVAKHSILVPVSDIFKLDFRPPTVKYRLWSI